MLSEDLKRNSIGFFRNRSDKNLIENLEWYERAIEAESRKKKPSYLLQRDKHCVEVLYHVLEHRGFFE